MSQIPFTIKWGFFDLWAIAGILGNLTVVCSPCFLLGQHRRYLRSSSEFQLYLLPEFIIFFLVLAILVHHLKF